MRPKAVKDKNELSFTGFFKFLKEKAQYNELIFIASAYVVSFVFLLFLYPLPSTLTDSANYVYCAQTVQAGGYRPFGYSWYLHAVHGISSSLSFMSFTQFLLTGVSTMYFIYTIKYFFRPVNTLLWRALLGFAVVAPSTLYMAHSLLSDSLFCFLTVIWFTTGIWILYTRNIAIFIIHLIFLYWAMEVRYTGLFYPAFSILIALFSYKKIQLQIGFSVLTIFVGLYFYQSTKNQMKKDFGVNVFSGFSGWQLLNNALHIVPHVDMRNDRIKDQNTKAFIEFLYQKDIEFYNRGVSAHLMWHKESPLKNYLYWKMQAYQIDYRTAWLLCGQEFSKYASHIIKEHPSEFFKYYLLPNTANVFLPRGDRGVISHIEDISADKMFEEYYGIKQGTKFSTGRSMLFTTISPFLVIGNLLLWIVFLTALIIGMIKRKMLEFKRAEVNIIIFLALFAGAYAAFNAFAGPFEFRYIIPIRLIMIVLPFILLNAFYNSKLRQAK